MLRTVLILLGILLLASAPAQAISTASLNVAVVPASVSSQQWVIPTTIGCGPGVAVTMGGSSISGTTLTVAAGTAFFQNEPGPIIPGMAITGSGVTPGTVVVSQLTSTDHWGEPGRLGTYQVNNSQTVPSEVLNGGMQLRCQMPALGSYTGDSVLVMAVWSVGSTPATVTRMRVRNGAALCTAATSIVGPTTPGSTNGVVYLCPNLTDRANVFDIDWSVPVSYASLRAFEAYGCGATCTVDTAAAMIGAPTGTISTPQATTGNNDLILSFLNSAGSNLYTAGACCTAIPQLVGTGSAQFAEYQVGATPKVYTNTFSGTGASNSFQAIVALKPGTPAQANPGGLGIYPFTFTASDTATQGTVVGHPTSGTVGNSYFTGTFQLTSNPGNLLTMTQVGPNAAAGTGPIGQLALARTLTPADDGTYTGQMSATVGTATIVQPITLQVLAPRPALPLSTNCSTVPPPAAVRAGLTTLAYCLDGAAVSKAIASNWIDCNGTNGPGFEWYIGNAQYSHLTGPTICSSISQVKDPISGRTVLDLHYDSTNYFNLLNDPNHMNGTFANLFVLTQQQGDPTKPEQITTFPVSSYYEIGFRATKVTGAAALGNAPAPDFWSLQRRVGTEKTDPRWGSDERDFFEMYGPYQPNSFGSAIHDWVNGGSGPGTGGVSDGNDAPNNIPGWTASNGVFGWHNYGNLETTNGTSVVRWTSYVDDVLNAPASGGGRSGYNYNPFDQPVLQTQVSQGLPEAFHLTDRTFMLFWWGQTWGLNTPACQARPACVAAGGQSNTDQFIDHIAVWTCPNYATDPTCNINGLVEP